MRSLIKLLLASCLIGSGQVIQAQNAISATGCNAAGTGGSINYTIGQVVYNVISGSNGTIIQGVQQPYEISVVTGIEEASGVILESSVYPNPTTGILTLKFENIGKENLTYKLSDVNGKLLENKKITGNETTISMANLLPGIYFLKVNDNRKEIRIFKIIKY